MKNHESPKDAARRLVSKNLEIEKIYNWSGFWNIRLKPVNGAKKEFRAMHITDQGEYVLRLPEFSNGKPLYRLNLLISLTSDPVIICEGEKCVDVLEKLGFLATTSGGAQSAEKSDWSVLAGRDVIIWPDNDEPGKQYALTVAKILVSLKCKIKIVDVDKLNLPNKGDAYDWLEENQEASKKDVLNLSYVDYKAGEHENIDAEIEEANQKKSQASELVLFAKERVELFHDKNSEVYARDLATSETRRLNSRQFKDWLIAYFYEETGKSVRDQSFREAIGTLSGLARHKGDCHEVHIRVAELNGNYYVDLAESGTSRTICISSGKWEIINQPPIRFFRPETLRTLPEPMCDGNLSELWNIINIEESDQILVIAWLIECLRPETPFPLLEIIGEQGSAKSTTQKILRMLIDPNACDLRAAPKAIEDIFVSGGVNWVVSYENISYLSPAMQDALCTLSTGAGHAKRKLYSDADESVIIVKRPIVLNGISVAVTAQDLIDRTISLEAPVISKRIEVNDIFKRFLAEQPKLLGALLDIFAKALAILPKAQLPSDNYTRLIEFAKLGISIARAMGKNDEAFLSPYSESRQNSIARTIDASPVATALIEWFGTIKRSTTRLPAKELFKQVEQCKPDNADNWPRSPKGFADILRRVAPALRQLDIECCSDGKRGGVYWWKVSDLKKSVSSCLESPDVMVRQQDIETCMT